MIYAPCAVESAQQCASLLHISNEADRLHAANIIARALVDYAKPILDREAASQARHDAKCAALEDENSRLKQALRDARGWFQEYANSHTAKGDTEKASRNQSRADLCGIAAGAA